MSRRVEVISAWTASYSSPITVAAGETLRLTGRTNDWDGYTWCWAAAPDGREGWIPDHLVEIQQTQPVARFDYSAAELTCAEGDTLICLEETHGWSWCESSDGETGWVPSRNLQ